MERSSPVAAVAETFARRFTNRAGEAGVLSFADFMDLALYDAEVGYYRATRVRVGRAAGTDFYTATNLDRVFGPLVAAAAATLVGPAKAGAHEWIEIGAEPGQSTLADGAHPFAGMHVGRNGAKWVPPAGRAVVFSNELFDAQPFHRLVRRGAKWCEMGVRLAAERCVWCELPEFSAELAAAHARLPNAAPEGYVLDVPLRAESLLQQFVATPWRGLFLAFDYGRTWAQLGTEFPNGTGRAYAAHRRSDDLLAQPGRQDLTCHVCWDWLEDALRAAGFQAITRESQEAFFVRHATDAIERIITREPDPLSPTRSQLKHLLHPGLMGQRFEALWARR